MKNKFFSCILILCLAKGYAQTSKFTYGVKINTGVGYLKSANLDNILSSDKKLDPLINTYDSDPRLRVNFGIGGFLDYKFTNKFSVLSELGLGYSNTRILINYQRTNIDSAGNGDMLRISSQAGFKFGYMNLSILPKYEISGFSKIYILTGPSINLLLTPKIHSKESAADAFYSNGSIDTTIIQDIDARAKITSYKAAQINWVIGAGKTFRLNAKGNNLNVDVRYSLPLTKMNFYSNDKILESGAINNSVFTENGKKVTEERYPSYKLNDFKYGTITVSVGYIIGSK